MKRIIGALALIINLAAALSYGDKFFNLPRSFHFAVVIYLIIDFLKNKITINIYNK